MGKRKASHLDRERVGRKWLERGVKNQGNIDGVRGGGKEREKKYVQKGHFIDEDKAERRSPQPSLTHFSGFTGHLRPAWAGLLSQLRAFCSTSGDHIKTHHSS